MLKACQNENLKKALEKFKEFENQYYKNKNTQQKPLYIKAKNIVFYNFLSRKSDLLSSYFTFHKKIKCFLEIIPHSTRNIMLSKKKKETLINDISPGIDLNKKIEFNHKDLVELQKFISELDGDKQKVEALNILLAAYDPYTGIEHGEVFSIIVEKISEKIIDQYFKNTISQKEKKTLIQTLKLAAKVHDIGKLLVSRIIINKPGKLTAEEKIIMDNHTKYSFIIMKLFNIGDQKIIDAALHHHESLNRPNQDLIELLPEKETKLMLFATQLIAIADLIDAMASIRFYRKPYYFNKDFIERILKNNKKLNQNIVKLVINNKKLFDDIYNLCQQGI